ncbi:MAG: terminase small subunit [Dehalococcoidales bacterium]|nr:terminase small subunit [Dehalococcoidales bacterium]
MSALLNQRWELFCIRLCEGRTQTEAAIVAGYKPSRARQTGARLVTIGDIQTRLQELRQKAEDATVMNVLERKQRLTEIARAKLTDFMELGQDGSWVNIGAETPNGGAIQEIHSRTEYDDDGAHPTVHTSVKLHDPVKAIDLLNKMDGIYKAEGAGNEGEAVKQNVNVVIINGDEVALAVIELLRCGAIGGLIEAGAPPVDEVHSPQADTEAARLPLAQK